MKKFKYFALFIAAGLFAACSDNLNEGNGDNNDGPLTGKGYVNLAINLPTESGSRATDEPTFENGDEAEYQVQGLVLAFFNESNLIETVNLPASLLGPSIGSSDQITSKYSFVYDQAPLEADGLLVILNPTSENFTINSKDIQIKDNNLTNLNGLTTTPWSVSEADLTNTENGFMMINSPLSNSSGQIQTLVPITVYKSRNEATKNPAKVYVERVVAKVEVSTNGNTSEFTVTAENSTYQGNKVTLIGWTLNRKNKVTYPVRNVNEITLADNEDFKDNSQVESNTDLYRIYWAKDPNYIYVANENLINNYTSATGDECTTIFGKSLYCLENTGGTDTYKYNQTTSVLIKANYMFGEASSPTSFFKIGNGTKLYYESDFITEIKKILGISDNSGYTVSINDVGAGVYESTELSNLIKIVSSTTPDNAVTDLYEKLQNIQSVSFFKGGVCYYTVPIIHINKNVTDENNTYLGKYGVLRNNWYKLNINSISGPGDPDTEPDDPGAIIDPEYGYINAEINVLKWAVRTQDVNL